MRSGHTNKTQADRSDQTRTRILEAAIHAFSENGLAGARTEQIADAAGVNKALLYYYFRNKDALYAAALEAVAERAVSSGLAVMSGERSAGEQLVRFALNHFDRIHSQRPFQSLLQQEMMRLRLGEKNAMTPLVEKVFRPMMGRVKELLTEGMRTGELIDVDPWQMMYAALGANVFYFLSGSVMQMLEGESPLAPEALRARRKAAVEYLGQTIFWDRQRGACIARCVLAQVPMPENTQFREIEVKG
jgi:TetR/AcrR family transcriptional regulator